MKIRKKRLFKATSALVVSTSLFLGSFPHFAKAEEPHLTLTATPNYSMNEINFGWNMSDKSNPYVYKLYQKREDSNEFQSISAKEKVKVLNVYPTVNPKITYTTWNGVTRTIDKSASVEMWMESPNNENPKGYGMGLIDVDPVSLPDFNANPQKYLKNPDGSWKYDVIYFGAWDTNNQQNPNDEAIKIIEQFINYGGGVLGGHDTIGYNWGTSIGLGKLRKYFNIKVGYWSYPEHGTDEGHNYFSGLVSTKVKVSRKGLLSQYPWELGEVGTVYNVPLTHSTSNFAYGDIWFRFQDESYYSGHNAPSSLYNYADYYLTTWNNTAMIQTGHSNGDATSDEQKILANTLFYLAQLTTATSWVDHSGRDTANPNAPTFTKADYNKKTGKLQINFTKSQDNGTEYTYYVEATNLNSNAKYTSNPITLNMVSGIKGYSIAIDTNPNTIPDDTIDTSATEYTTYQNLTKDFYIHIKAIDYNGNTSSTEHIKIGVSSDKIEFDINTQIKTLIKPKVYFN